jgi:hypothetical protein
MSFQSHLKEIWFSEIKSNTAPWLKVNWTFEVSVLYVISGIFSGKSGFITLLEIHTLINIVILSENYQPLIVPLKSIFYWIRNKQLFSKTLGCLKVRKLSRLEFRALALEYISINNFDLNEFKIIDFAQFYELYLVKTNLSACDFSKVKKWCCSRFRQCTVIDTSFSYTEQSQ